MNSFNVIYSGPAKGQIERNPKRFDEQAITKALQSIPVGDLPAQNELEELSIPDQASDKQLYALVKRKDNTLYVATLYSTTIDIR